MKKLSLLLIVMMAVLGTQAQCVVNPNLLALDSTTGGYYPSSAHLPHIVQDSAYDQVVQGKIATGYSQSFTIPGIPIPITATLTVDSVRLDSIQGLPSGINWAKSANVLPGGGLGCVEFTGSTTDSAGTYRTNSIGMIWVHISVPGILDEDTFQYGSLNMLPAYSNFYVVVDSAEDSLTATLTARTSCASLTAGSATVTAAGGSPVSPYTYLWNNGVTSYTINNVAAGTYYVTVTSGIDTIMDSVVVLGDPTPIAVTVTADSGSDHGTGQATISVSGGIPPYTYRWNNGDTTASIDSLAPGTYHVTVRDSLGCRTTDSVVIANLAAGINIVAQTTPQLSIYPNPTPNQLHVVVQSPVALNARMEVVDITGQVVYSAPAAISTARFTQTIDVSKLSAGIYILQLTGNNQSVHQRFVVAH